MPKSKKRKPSGKKKKTKTPTRTWGAKPNSHAMKSHIAVGLYATVFRTTPEFRADILDCCRQQDPDLLIVTVDARRGATFKPTTVADPDGLLALIREDDPSYPAIKALQTGTWLRPKACFAEKQLPSALISFFDANGNDRDGFWIVERTEEGIIHHQGWLPDTILSGSA